MSHIIEVEHLCFAYEEGAKTIDDISFTVEKGSYTCIVGHNGSGKSTVAKLLAGLLDRASGEIRIDGMSLDLEHLSEIRSRIGIVFQNPDNQFIGSTVRDDIAFGLENHRVPREEMDGIIDTNAEKVGMTDYLDKEPGKLSGGQKQRVAIAGVLAMRPDILIFDEATSMLDPQGKAEIKKVIMDLHKETGITIVSITHDIEEVASADAVVALYHGKIAMTGKPMKIFADDNKIKSIGLDLPYSIKFANKLKDYGVKVKRHLDLEGLAEELCQSGLKM